MQFLVYFGHSSRKFRFRFLPLLPVCVSSWNSTSCKLSYVQSTFVFSLSYCHYRTRVTTVGIMRRLRGKALDSSWFEDRQGQATYFFYKSSRPAYSLGTGEAFSRGKVSGTWSWLLSSNAAPSFGMSGVCQSVLSPICLHGAHRDDFLFTLLYFK